MTRVCCIAATAIVLACPAAAAPPQYVLSVVGGFAEPQPYGPVSMPLALNDHGMLVGYGTSAVGGTRGLSWQGGTLVDLGIPAGLDRSYASRVNNLGQIVGGAARVDGSVSRALLWESTSAVVPMDLGSLGGRVAAALGINGSGRVVGYSTLPGEIVTRAFSWQHGTMTALAMPAAYGDSLAYDIGGGGHIAGLATRGGQARPVVWTGGELTELPLPANARAGAANAVNDFGHAAGIYELSSPVGAYGAALWRDGVRTDLGFLSSAAYSIAADINNAGQVVGTAGIPGGLTGFLWHEGVMHDLRTLLTGTFTGHAITSARAINDSGKIAAVALIGGREMAVVLTPVPAPGAWALLTCAGLFAARRKRSR
jgi:probable HAF family extracellular repeat protein